MWWGYPHGFGFFPFLLFPFGFLIFIVLCFIVAYFVSLRRFRSFGGACGRPTYGPWNKGDDPEVILKRRLANGTVTEEEYKHLRDMLKE